MVPAEKGNLTLLVSVLLPSRGRPGSLHGTITGLFELATDPGQVEILIAADPDDDATIHAPLPEGNIRMWVAPERYGYHGLHHYVNHLATMSGATWLMLWNDDAKMLSRGWDAIIGGYDPSTVIWPTHNDAAAYGCNIFPIWPRIWTDCMGHVALNAHCDSWIQDVGNDLGRTGERNTIAIMHDRFDLTGGHNDGTYRDRIYTKDEYFQMEEARHADADKIREKLH